MRPARYGLVWLFSISAFSLWLSVESRVLEIVGLESGSGLILGDFCDFVEGSRESCRELANGARLRSGSVWAELACSEEMMVAP